MVKSYQKNRNKTKNRNRNKNKISVKKTRSNKRIFGKKNYGGGGTITITSYNDIIRRKRTLIASFDTFNTIIEDYKTKNDNEIQYQYPVFNYVTNSNRLLWAYVQFCYYNFVIYNKYHELFEGLKKNDIIHCKSKVVCPEAPITLINYEASQYKFFKIYFVIGFIMAYYFRNPGEFIDPKIVDKKLLYIFKDFLLTIGCNLIELSDLCILNTAFERLINDNGYNVNLNTSITKLIMDFVKSDRIILDINKFFYDEKYKLPDIPDYNINWDQPEWHE